MKIRAFKDRLFFLTGEVIQCIKKKKKNPPCKTFILLLKELGVSDRWQR